MLTTRTILSRAALFLPALVVLAAQTNPLRAGDDVDPKALTRAHDFLKTAQRGADILSFVHYGAKYGSHAYQQRLTVVNQKGERVPGHFALDYQFKWEDDGVTDVRFFCDAQGGVYEVQIVKTNARLQQPYFAANLAIKVIGNLLIEAFKDNLNDAQRKEIQQIVDDADAKRMLEWSLKFQQALGK
jgi:hypothetical protein